MATATSRMTAKQANKLEEDIEEMKKSLNHMGVDIAKALRNQDMMVELMKEVKNLKTEVKEKDKKIEELSQRVDELEQYSRREDVILTGITLKPRSYARAADPDKSTEEDAPVEDLQTLERQVISFLESKEIQLDANDISACHTLPQKEKSNKPPIIIRFVNRKSKTELLKQGKKLRGTDVYMNEHLTKKNGGIAKEARNLKREKKIQGTWTRNCSVFIRLNGTTPEQAKTVKVRKLSDLDPYR